ncbi:MAG: DUF4407 domain-containing protein [Candidatus Obscuribacterales bacterium]|nr:DUF4407 domain-containing protein [Candidatus Obscuribacterales bacterium]
MSIVHKVIVLNTPLKIRGYTVPQWILLAVSVGLAFFIGAKVPPDWKIGNLPLGLFVGLAIFSVAIVFIFAAETKPMAWWRNFFLYRIFNTMPKAYYPHIEEQTQLYPDPDLVDAPKREEGGYIELGS